jgi:hypothetical protein
MYRKEIPMDNQRPDEHQKPDHEKSVDIIVNGQVKQVTAQELAFEAVVNLAFDNNPPTGPDVVITVTYSKGEGGKQGSLLPGDRVAVKDDMVFNVKATNKS